MADSDAPSRYALCCTNKTCGHIEDKEWQRETETTHSYRLDGSIFKTPDGQEMKRPDIPLRIGQPRPKYCPKCFSTWRVATKKDLEAHDAREAAMNRAIELTKYDNFDGLFKIPDELRASPEVKKALSNLLAPLDGEVLRAAQSNVLKVAKSGMSADFLTWISYYDRAVEKAIAGARKSA